MEDKPNVSGFPMRCVEPKVAPKRLFLVPGYMNLIAFLVRCGLRLRRMETIF